MHSQQNFVQTKYYSTLFGHCFKVQFKNDEARNWCILLPGLNNRKSTKYICKSLPAKDRDQACYLQMQGQCLELFIKNSILENRLIPVMIENQIWTMIDCITSALRTLSEEGNSKNITHFKEYCIRKLEIQNIYKLIYHQSIRSQLQLAKSGEVDWQELYLSPEELNGEFIQQKSIVFSFGVLLLNLCAFQHKKVSINIPGEFLINEQVIREKIFLAREVNGYSKLLCNFISACLMEDYKDRWGFVGLRQNFQKKISMRLEYQSLFLSYYLEHEKSSSITYDLILEQSKKQFKQQQEKTQNKQTSSNSLSKSKINKGSKFEGSGIKKTSGSKEQSMDPSANFNTNLVNDSRFQFRGTFGEHRRQPQSDVTDHHKQQCQIPQKNAQIRSKQNLKTENKKNKNMSMQININLNDYEKKQFHEVDTPKGFGKAKPFNPYEDKIGQPVSMKKNIQNMIYLNLDYCLKPVEVLVQEIGKIGVWVEGDLYYGDFLNGRRHGLGLEIFANGEYYYGFFQEDLFQGEGLYFWTPYEYFFGHFELGQKKIGRLQGDLSYNGEFKDNKRHGYGICEYPSGQIYEGSWINGKKHGNGLSIDPNGYKFEGNWNKGKRRGQGTLYSDSMEITGEWNSDIVQGKVIIKYSNGDHYQGVIGKDLEKLSGKYVSNSGRIFIGEFQNDQPKRGQLLYSNGDRYVGELQGSKRHGFGQYFYVSGEVYRGTWFNNLRKN